jgi:hypothetical protein
MKHIIHFFLFLLFTAQLWAQDGGQSGIYISSSTVDSTFTIDITDSDLDLGIHTIIKNNTQDSVNIKWVRTIKEMPMSWETYICIDNFLCFFPESSTNYDPANQIEDPLPLSPGDSMDFALHVLPQNVMGDGAFEIAIALTSKPDSVIGKIEFNVVVRDLSSSTSALQVQDVRVFPNPAADYIMLSEYSQISRVDIYSILGRRMRSFPIVNDSSLDISGLPNGMYLVGLVNRSGRTVRTLRLIKRHYRP